MKQQLFFLLLAFIIASCSNNKTYNMPLNELNKLTLEPEPNTYLLTIEAKGKSDCPIKLTLIKDNNEFGTPYLLSGQLDTLFRRDWYQSKLSFKVEPISCTGNIDVEIKLYQ